MLKTSGSTKSRTQLGEGKVGVGGSRAGQDEGEFDRSKIGDSEVDGGEIGDDEIGKKVQKSFKSNNLSKLDFLTSETKLAFTKLRQVFVKAPIFYHFNQECHIQIGTDASGYAIGGVFSQLTLDNSGQ